MTRSVIDKKKEKEIAILEFMISLYCLKRHGGEEICSSCKSLLDYSSYRVSICPFMEGKTFCSNCKVHCFEPDMREKIKEAMRFSGPRMIIYHPLMTINHFLQDLRRKIIT